MTIQTNSEVFVQLVLGVGDTLRVRGTLDQKQTTRAIHGRYFQTYSFRRYLRFGLKVLELKVNSKILLFAEI